jgi:hypothetical protein
LLTIDVNSLSIAGAAIEEIKTNENIVIDGMVFC